MTNFVRRAEKNPKSDKSELVQNVSLENIEELREYFEHEIEEEIETMNELVNATVNRFFKKGIVCAEMIEESEMDNLENILNREFGTGLEGLKGQSIWLFEGEIVGDLPDGYIVRVTNEPRKIYEY